MEKEKTDFTWYNNYYYCFEKIHLGLHEILNLFNYSDLGDGLQRWMRGMPRPDCLFTPLRDDFYIYVIGCIMRYVEIEASAKGFKLTVLKSFKHGFDAISIMEADPIKEVYAIAEKGVSPRVQVCRVEKTKKDHYQPRIVAKLTGIFLI